MCVYSRLILNRKYFANKKNGGDVPTVNDERTRYVPVGCGDCFECRNAKANEWRVRLQEEIKHDRCGKFITFSFSNESLIELKNAIFSNVDIYNRLSNRNSNGLSGYNLDNEIATVAVRRFLERWRKKFGKSVKHWFITELGQINTERIHLHGILFTNESEATISNIWRYGNVWIGDYVSNRTCNYIIKYVHKTDEKHPLFKSKVLTSHGIGKSYINNYSFKRHKFDGENTIETYRDSTGAEYALPIYYRNKFWSDDEREQLWMHKLDSNIVFVDGMGYDISISDTGYIAALKRAQAKNRRLGFGCGEVDWEKKEYINTLRLLKHSEYI